MQDPPLTTAADAEREAQNSTLPAYRIERLRSSHAAQLRSLICAEIPIQYAPTDVARNNTKLRAFLTVSFAPLVPPLGIVRISLWGYVGTTQK
jgi:hypothetical protein